MHADITQKSKKIALNNCSEQALVTYLYVSGGLKLLTHMQPSHKL